MKKRVILSSIFFSLVLLAFYFDNYIAKRVFLLRTDFLNDFFLGITFVSSEIVVFFVLTSMFLYREHKRKWILPLWFTLFLSVVVSFILKFLVKRLRPFQTGIVSVLPVLEKASHEVWNFSFPSFQAMLVFCAIPILSKEFPKFKWVWCFFAFLVAFSRVYFGVHFLSDVLVGGLIGYLIGIFVINLEKKYKFSEKFWNILKK